MLNELQQRVSQRRTFLNSAGVGLGTAAMSALMARKERASNSSDVKTVSSSVVEGNTSAIFGHR